MDSRKLNDGAAPDKMGKDLLLQKLQINRQKLGAISAEMALKNEELERLKEEIEELNRLNQRGR
jgi:hypothetical protein